MRCASNGDRQQFEALIHQHHPRLRGFARKLCHRGGIDPEDLVQDTLERALRQRAWLVSQSERTCQVWLNTTLRRRFLDLSRRQQTEEVHGRALELLQLPVVVRQPRQWQTWERVSEDHLRQCIAWLKPFLREAFELHAAGLRYKDIARRLGTPVGTIGCWIFQARRELRARLLSLPIEPLPCSPEQGAGT